MKKNLILLLSLFLFSYSFCQDVSFKKSTLNIKEPQAKDTMVKQKARVILNAKGLKNKVIKADIEMGKESTYPALLINLITKKIDTLKEENSIEVELTTDPSDKTNFIIFKVSYKDTADESQLLQDTLFVENTFPYSAESPYSKKDWNDGKSAEIFIGTNFDFFDKPTLTDWYGGVRVFLPEITNLRYKNSRKNARWGLAGGIYHSKSFSNFGNGNGDGFTTVTNRVLNIFSDTVNGVAIPKANVQYDTLKATPKSEINNWAAYINPFYQWSKFEGKDVITNIYVGFLAEVIRRNIHFFYDFDTLGSTQKQIPYASIRGEAGTRLTGYTQIYYDAYFGVTMPIQVLWKDILDLKIIPGVGIGSPGYVTKKDDPSHKFYLVQYDLLIRLGGLKLNLGGEVRGYFPNQSPIFSAYLGTSFSIEKLADFISKK
jgi:hypothetical protein